MTEKKIKKVECRKCGAVVLEPDAHNIGADLGKVYYLCDECYWQEEEKGERGMLRNKEKYIFDREMFWTQCPECGGTGVDALYQRCMECGGWGEILVDEEEA